ncbi:MAG: helix-turn-helix domain-containing protein [bacterium]|nr:helix-turn-helix domain-containing protein [bacterium]
MAEKDFVPLTMAEVEKRYILSVLKKNRGRRNKTAQQLGIGLRTLGLKINQYREAGYLPPKEQEHSSSCP